MAYHSFQGTVALGAGLCTTGTRSAPPKRKLGEVSPAGRGDISPTPLLVLAPAVAPQPETAPQGVPAAATGTRSAEREAAVGDNKLTAATAATAAVVGVSTTPP